MPPTMKFWKRSATLNGAPNPNPPHQGGAPPQVVRKTNTDILYRPQNVDGVEQHCEVILAYNLKWEKLRDYLRREYEGVKFADSQMGIQDVYRVWLPTMFNTRQKDEVEALRERSEEDTQRISERDRYSPDPM